MEVITRRFSKDWHKFPEEIPPMGAWLAVEYLDSNNNINRSVLKWNGVYFEDYALKMYAYSRDLDNPEIYPLVMWRLWD